MTPASSKDARRQAVLFPAVCEPALNPSLAIPPAAAELELGDLTVLEAVMGQNEPVTVRRIAKLTDLPAGQAQGALEALCEVGLLRRLNTIVESYTTRFR